MKINNNSFDLNEKLSISNASVIVINYTLQFIQPANRDSLLKNIYNALVPGGSLILIEKVKSKIEKINAFDVAELKQFYMETLTDGKISSKGGAGLGFITIAMKSKNKLDYSFVTTIANNNLFKLISKVTQPED